MDFEIGDVVVLNSGGPQMTISWLGATGSGAAAMACQWFGDTGTTMALVSGSFHPNTVFVAKKRGGPVRSDVTEASPSGAAP